MHAFVKQKAPELFASAVSSTLCIPELRMPSRRSQKILSSFQKWSELINENSTFGESLVNLVVEHAFFREYAQSYMYIAYYNVGRIPID